LAAERDDADGAAAATGRTFGDTADFCEAHAEGAGDLEEGFEVSTPLEPTWEVGFEVQSPLVLRSLRWRFGARRGACVKQLSSALPESKRGRLSVGDRLVAINGVDVFALPRSEIKAIWRAESLKCDELMLRFASPS